MATFVWFFLAFSALSLGQAGAGPLHLQDEPTHLHLIPERLIGSPTRALPTSIEPIHYNLILRPIVAPGEWTTPGELNLTIECVESTNRITIHQLDIEMGDTMVWHVATGAELTIVGIEENQAENEYTLVLDANLVPGERYIVFYQFVSPIPASPLAGLYRSSYVNPTTGVTHWLAATQFQESAARRAFPCFDEPGIRSVFEITLVRRESFQTLCNMGLNRTDPDPVHEGWVWDQYNPTPAMPVYIIAIVVSDYDHYEAPLDEMNGRPSRVWSAPHRIAAREGDYAAVTSARSILAFESIFQIDYVLPKLDSATVPDFTLAAMENWGLVLYRNNYLLYSNETNSEVERRQVTSVISHELTHQWFGNLVTCSTWAELWLNEGFATYFEYIGMHATDPEYDALDWMVPDAYQPGLAFDETTASQPIYYDGVRPSTIVYSKAGSVIRMMNRFLGEDTFIAGLRRYLNRHSFQPVTQDQLFQALTEQAHEDGTLPSNLDMKLIMDTWTHQSGFPLLRVFRLSSTHISYTQESYGPNPRKINSTLLDPAHFWYIPFRLRSPTLPGTGDSDIAWMSKTQTFSTFGPLDTNLWILVNPDSAGFFRVLYDNALSQMLQTQLLSDHTQIPVGSRAQLIDDHLKFAFATPVAYTTVANALGFTRYLGSERSLYPWLSFFNNMGGTVFNTFHGHPSFIVFKDYYGSLVASVLALIGEQQPPNERGVDVILRARLLDWDCAFGGQICKDYASELYQAIETVPVPADLQAVMYCAIAAHGDPASSAGFDLALVKWLEALNTPGAEVQATRWRNALGCATRASEIEDVLNLAMNNGALPKTDQLALLHALARSREGRAALLEWLPLNFSALLEVHAPIGFQAIMETLRVYISVEEHIAQLEALVEAYTDELEAVLPGVHATLAQMERNVEWMDNYGRQIVEWILP